MNGRMVTIRDVAAIAQVSTSTVSHVINDTRYVSPATRERVLNAMAKLNYSPNRLARSLRSSRTLTLGVLLPNSANPFFAELLLGVEAACFDLGYNIIMGNANDNPARELAYLEVLLSRKVDGILLISTGAFKESIALLASHDVPVVVVDRATNLPSVDEIFTENKQGGMIATNYLLNLGHVRIGCITGPSFLTPSAERVAGYYEAMKAAGISADSRWVVIGDFQHETGYSGCQRLLRLPEPPTAIFACNDLMAVGALCAVHEAGLRVPDDISVIGYDDIPLASYTVPRLTTIAQPARQLGRLAVERLVARLQNQEMPVLHDKLAVTLVVRDSCRMI
jgi:LacI family transcriptional regulator